MLVWDISKSLTAIDQKKRKQSVRHIGKPGLGAGGDDDEPVAALPPVQPLAVSHIDMSHRRLVADLAWLPTSTQVRRSNLSTFELPTRFELMAISCIFVWRLSDLIRESIARARLCFVVQCSIL